MRRRTFLIACAVLGALAPLPAAIASGEAPAAATPPPAFVPRQVIIQWSAGAGRADKSEAREEAEVENEANLGDPSFQLVEVEPGQTVAAAIEGLEADPAVAVVERDSYSVPTSIPNDPLFGQEWGLQNTGAGIDGFSGAIAAADIHAPGAWTSTLGTPSTVVADIDSGYRFNSPDLGPVAWENPGEIPGNGIDDDSNGYVDDVHGYDFVGSTSEAPSQDADPTDDNLVSGGHGVHTAGTIGAAGNNEVGITGVAQNARIMPLRVCANSPAVNEGRCPTSSIIAAINYAGANGARAANISLGGTVKSTAELNAFAENPQTLFVIAAGNDSQNNDIAGHYPCDYEPASTGISGAIDNIVCVAATNQADQLAAFSDWGKNSVDLGAPGTEILSTYPAIEDLFGEGFEEDNFEAKWSATGAEGGFARTSEAPLTSFGIADSPGAAPVSGSVRESILTAAISVPAGYGGCQFSGRRFVSLGGGTFNQKVLEDGVSVFNSNPPNTSGSAMVSFLTVPITGLAGSSVTVRFRYTAGPSPSASSGVWLDDLKLTCYAPVSTPPAYEYLQGTSMAAPHVTGTAALLFSLRPAATVTAVRGALLGGVDPVASLAGKTVTAGRLDAAQAVTALTEPPAPPSLTSTDPGSPSDINNPRILGSADAGSTVQLYAGASCEGDTVTSGTAAQLASPGIAVEVADDSIDQFSATATNVEENTSSCSAPLSYTEDSTRPQAPSLTATAPASPADNEEPKIVGSAEAGSTVDIYSGALCEGSPVADGTAAELASPGITVSVPNDSSSQFSATATDAAQNSSFCSGQVTYTEDSTAPKSPSLSSTDPVSPANENEPRIVGSAEAGSTLNVYVGPSCQDSAVASGTATELGSLGIEVSVNDDSVNEFSATATDAASNTSLCSAPIAYNEDSTAPAPPLLTGTDPPSPEINSHPRVIGYAEAGSTVQIFVGTGCEGSPAVEGGAGEFGFSGIAVDVPPATTREFSAEATDAVENTSACSGPISYTNSSSVAVVGPGEVVVLPLAEPLPSLTIPGADLKPPSVPSCRVPKLIGKTLGQAKSKLSAAGCRLGRVSKPRSASGTVRHLVVKSSSPAAGSASSRAVSLKLGPKPKQRHH